MGSAGIERSDPRERKIPTVTYILNLLTSKDKNITSE